MWRTRVLLLLVATVLIIALYNLPKVVVDDKERDLSGDETESPAAIHGSEPTIEDLDQISHFKSELQKSSNKEKSSIFADSLAEAFRSINRWDSAAYYLGIQATQQPSIDNLLKAGEAYFQAQGFAVNQSGVEAYGERARKFFEQVLKLNPNDLETKTRIGLTYMASSNPMQGISIMREVLEQDPENEMALYNMGILSMQSSQWDRAIQRFEKLVEIDPKNSKAHFYLGLSYKETGQPDSAIVHFNKVKELDKDPEIQANVDSYLKEINNNKRN